MCLDTFSVFYCFMSLVLFVNHHLLMRNKVVCVYFHSTFHPSTLNVPAAHYVVCTSKYPAVLMTDQRAHPSWWPVSREDPVYCRPDADVNEGGTTLRIDERLLPTLRVMCDAHGRHRVAILDRIIERCQFGHPVVAVLRCRQRMK